MKDNVMYIIQNGQTSNLEKTFKLESGAVVSSDGTVKYPTGKTVQLKNGQFIEITKVATTGSDEDTKATTGKKSTTTKKTTKTTKKTGTKSKTGTKKSTS